MQTTQLSPVTVAPAWRRTHHELDALTIVAVALVVVGHLWLGRVSGGVDVLLVLVGYLFGIRILHRDGSVWTPAWGWARRLIPALVLMLTACAALTVLVQPQTRWESFAEQTLSSLGFYQNWLLATTASDYVQAGETVTPLQHLWALSVAGQVLLAMVVAAWLIRRRGPVLATAAIASLVWAIMESSGNQTVAYYSSLTRAWELLTGVLAAALAGRMQWPAWLRRIAVVAGLAAIIASGLLVDGVAAYPGPWALIPVLATVLVILAAQRGTPGVAVAGFAYALYLWHWPLLIFWLAHTNDDTVGIGESVAILAGAAAASWLTWLCVRPRGTAPWRPAVSAAVTATLVVLLAVGAVGWRTHVTQVRDGGSELTALPVRDYPGARAVVEHRKVARLPIRPTGLEASDDVPPSTIDRCLADFGGEDVVSCVYGDPTASRTIAVAGGSHSEHWLTALHTLGRQYGFRVTTYLKMGCPLTTAEVPIIAGPFTPYPSCRTWSDNAMAKIISDRPDFVFFTTTRPILDGPGDYVPDYYLGIWDELSDNGIAMLGMRDTPWMLREGRFFSPVDCLADGDDADTCGLAREEALQERNPTLDHAADYPLMQLLDLSDAICRPSICRAAEGNVLIYHDAHHLSATYVRSLSDELARQLGAATGWF